MPLRSPLAHPAELRAQDLTILELTIKRDLIVAAYSDKAADATMILFASKNPLEHHLDPWPTRVRSPNLQGYLPDQRQLAHHCLSPPRPAPPHKLSTEQDGVFVLPFQRVK